MPDHPVLQQGTGSSPELEGVTRVSVPKARDPHDAETTEPGTGQLPTYDDDTLEMKGGAARSELEDTVSELPVDVLMPPDVPDLTPTGPNAEPPTQALRIPVAPELTPKTLERRHPRYGGQLFDAVMSEVTALPDRDQALDELVAQRRANASESDLFHRGASDPSRSPLESTSSEPLEFESSRSTFVTSMVVGMALVIVGAAMAILVLPLLPDDLIARLVPRGAPVTPPAPAPSQAEARRLTSPPSGVTAGTSRAALAPLAAAGDGAAMARLAGKPVSELGAAEIVALSSGQLRRRRADLVSMGEALASGKRKPSRELLREVLGSARDPGVAVEALLVLAQWPTSEGYDALWVVATRYKSHEPTRALARDLLASKDAAARLSPALAVAVELSRLRSAPADPPSCELASSIVARAREHADARSLHMLDAIQARSGCGPQKAADCFPCLRQGPALTQAIKAAARRPAPKLD